MKKSFVAFVLACMLLLCACTQPASAPAQPAVEAATPAPTEAPTPTPTPTATPEPTPTPTPTPKVESLEMAAELFSQNGITGTLTGIRYTEDRTVEVTLNISNKSKEDLYVFDGYGMTGSINGWVVTFMPPGMTSCIKAGNEEFLLPLSADVSDKMQIETIQTLSLSFSGYSDRSFDPKCKLITNPDCPEDYVQPYSGDAEPIYENKQMRYYDLGFDEEEQMLYLHAECLVKKHAVRITPWVNGYAQYKRYNYDFTADGQHAILALPLKGTMQEFDISKIDVAGICVEPYSNGQTFYGKAYAFPVAGGAWTEAAPAYAAESAPILESDKGITLYHTKTERSDAQSYSQYTDYTMVCVNNTENILWVYPESISLDGVKYEGGVMGVVPPFSVATSSLRAYAEIPDGAEITIGFRILDVRANFRNIVVEKVTFAS